MRGDGNAGTAPVLDASVLERLAARSTNGSRALARELVAAFLADAPERVATLVELAATAGEPAAGHELARAAHALAARAEHLGAGELRAVLLELERVAGAKPAAAPDVAATVGGALERVARALSASGWTATSRDV